MKITCSNLSDYDELTYSEFIRVFWIYFLLMSIQENYLENLMACFVLILFSKCFFLMPEWVAQKQGYFYSLWDCGQLSHQKIKQRLWLEAVEALHAPNISPHFQETRVVDDR